MYIETVGLCMRLFGYVFIIMVVVGREVETNPLTLAVCCLPSSV